MSSTNRPLTVTGVLLAISIAAMEATVVATAMPTVVQKLGGIEWYGWVISAYVLASAVTMPLYGKLADLYGRRRTLMIGLSIFLVGSLACGFAPSMGTLIAFRALQGIGAGGIQPIAITIIGDIFRPEERARIQGVFAAVWGVAGMSGPLVGGLIVRALSWRWIFFINVPFGILSAVVLTIAFHEKVETKKRSLDFAGAAALGGAIVALLLGATNVAPLVTIPAAIVLLALFAFIEQRVEEPVLSLALLRRHVILVASIEGALVGSVMSSTLAYLPLFVQAVLGGTPTRAGLAVSPMLVGWPLASALSGRMLLRFGYRPLIRCGFVLVAIAAFVVAWLVRGRASPVEIGAAVFVLGLGMGLANTPLIIAVQENAAWHERGVATASTMFFRSIGGAVAVGALGAIIATHLGDAATGDTVNALLGPEHGRRLAPEVLVTVSGRLADGLARVFDAVAAMSVLAVVAAMFFPNTRIAKAPVAPSADVAPE
jgi:EmrB/QacA subfamily drug resistance transporter